MPTQTCLKLSCMGAGRLTTGQNGRTLKDTVPFILLDFFRGTSAFTESKTEGGGNSHETI